ncbi:hypothetical protein GCM10027610_069400 [Dactylosporangium cerinum]
MRVDRQPVRAAGERAERVAEPRLLPVGTAEALRALPGMPRKMGTPALPDSIGMVSAMRWSNAPTTNAPLPKREHPVTPIASALRIRPSDPATTSMMRLTPHAHAISRPVPLVAP